MSKGEFGAIGTKSLELELTKKQEKLLNWCEQPNKEPGRLEIYEIKLENLVCSASDMYTYTSPKSAYSLGDQFIVAAALHSS